MLDSITFSSDVNCSIFALEFWIPVSVSQPVLIAVVIDPRYSPLVIETHRSSPSLYPQLSLDFGSSL